MSARASRLFLGVSAIALGALLAACGTSGASGSPAGSSPSAAASVAAPSAVPSGSAAESTQPSLDLGSFALPSGAKELEAILPNELCGSTAIKFSMAGAEFADGADEEFMQLLGALGKTAADTSFAAAGSTDGNCGAGIFRINGVDSGRLQQAFLSASETDGSTFTQKSVGGKNVFVLTMAGETDQQWVYFQGDAMLFVTADDETQAASILQAMP